MSIPSEPHHEREPRARVRSREEVLAEARPLPDSMVIEDLTDEEQDVFLAAIADA